MAGCGDIHTRGHPVVTFAPRGGGGGGGGGGGRGGGGGGGGRKFYWGIFYRVKGT